MGSSLARSGCLKGCGQGTAPGRRSPLGLSSFNSAQPSSRSGTVGQEDANLTLVCGSDVRAEGKATNLPQNAVRRHFTLHLCRRGLWTTLWASHESPGFPPQHWLYWVRAAPQGSGEPRAAPQVLGGGEDKGTGRGSESRARLAAARPSPQPALATANLRRARPPETAKPGSGPRPCVPATERLQRFKTGHDGYSGLKRHSWAL